MNIEQKKEVKTTQANENLKVAITLPIFNETLGNILLKNVKQELINNNVLEENIKVFRVYGTLETPYACKKIFESHTPDVIIALGIVIKGDTIHFNLVSETTYNGLMNLQLQINRPIIFGILSCDTIEQAEIRVNDNKMNKGAEFAKAAIMQTQI